MIREATEQDLPSILDIYNDAIMNSTAVYSYEPHSLEQRMEWFRQKRQDNLPVLVYEADNRVMGFATFGPFRAWPAYQYTIEHSVYVDNECRHLGIGSRLLREIIRIAADSGYKTLVAGIDESNRGSITLHEKLGFTYAGTIRNAGYKFNNWLNLCFYQYELPGPDQPVERGGIGEKESIAERGVSMNIHLQPITADNWEDCIALKVGPGQEGLIASNLYSLAEAQFLDGFQCKGIYWDERMIGFAMYGIDPDDGNYWIYRFMVDASFQGQGLGKRALQLVLDEIGSRPDRTEHCLLGYDPNNEAARRLYASAGFVETGIAPWGEMMAKYDFPG